MYANGIKTTGTQLKDSEIKPYLMFLGNILKVFTVDNMKRNGLNGKYFNFSVSHETINVSFI